MDDEQAAKLRKLARAATPGPWEALRESSERHSVDSRAHTVADMTGWPWAQRERDAAYIAAASPNAILALLDERDALRRERDRAKDYAADMADTLSQIQAAIGLSGSPDADGLIAAAKALLDERDALRRERDEARAHFASVLRHPARIRTGVMAAGYVGGACEHSPGGRAKVTLFYEGAETAEAAFAHITDAIDALLGGGEAG